MAHGDPMTDPGRRRARATSFGAVSAVYEKARPGYPDQAVADLLGADPLEVVDLGAGTGKLTRTLLSLGHRPVAVDPSEGMLDLLGRVLPGVSRHLGTAESVPLPAGCADAVVAGQAYHWFTPETALPEIARLLRPGGVLGLLWNVRDDDAPWVARFGELVGSEDAGDSLTPPELGELFSPAQVRVYEHRHELSVDGLVDLAASRSTLAILDQGKRTSRLAQIRALGEQQGRGGVLAMPYRLQVWSGRLLSQPISGSRRG